MPNITDLFSKAADDSKSYPVVATVSEAREVGGKTLKLDSLAGWNTTTPVHFMSYSKKDGVIDLASQSDWKGLVVDNTITQLTLTRGVDNGHKVGDQIVLNPTLGWLDDLIGGLGVTLNPDGSLKDSIVKASNIDQNSFKQIYAAGRATAVTLSNKNGGNFIPFVYSDGAEYMNDVAEEKSPYNAFTAPEDGYYMAFLNFDFKAIEGTYGNLEMSLGGSSEGDHRYFAISSNKRMLETLLVLDKKTKGQSMPFYVWVWGSSGNEVISRINIKFLKVA